MKTRTKLILFAIGLLYLRMLHTGSFCFFFLIWNLFLAWLPFYFSNKVFSAKSQTFAYMHPAFSVLFLPNAAYIITDLFHLRKSLDAPMWMDTLLILSFALAGLWFWLSSTRQLCTYLIGNHLSERLHMATRMILCVLSAYGVYIGRYLRYNSWDVITDPYHLMQESIGSLVEADQYKETWAIILVYSIFLYIIYEIYINIRPETAESSQHPA